MARLDRAQKSVLLAAGCLGISASLWGGHRFLGQHLESHLMPRTVADERRADVLEQIRNLTDATMRAAAASEVTASALREHVLSQDLKDARARLDVLREQRSSTELWERANGENDVSRARKADLDRQLERTRDFIACREANRAGCAL